MECCWCDCLARCVLLEWQLMVYHLVEEVEVALVVQQGVVEEPSRPLPGAAAEEQLGLLEVEVEQRVSEILELAEEVQELAHQVEEGEHVEGELLEQISCLRKTK